jgi:hypothetical protein
MTKHADASRPGVDLHWYGVSNLDTPPRLVQPLAPPVGLAPVRVRVRLDADGHVQALESVDADADFLARLRAARFVPATRDGRPVRVEMRLEFIAVSPAARPAAEANPPPAR